MAEPDFPRPDWPVRLDALTARLAALDADAFVVSSFVNVRYLTGFAGTAALLVVARDGRTLITDGRYDLAVREAIAAGRLTPVEVRRVDRRYDLTLAECLGATGAERIAFEAAHVTVATHAA